MKVLFVSSGNSSAMPFVSEQADSLKTKGVKIDEFKIIGRGVLGYLKNLNKIKAVIKENDYDIVHAHYGLSGLLCVLQRKVPVVITYHGSDINLKYVRILSLLASKLAIANIFVSNNLKEKAGNVKNSHIIPCGIDPTLFRPLDKNESKTRLKLDLDKNYLLFSSSFNNPVKNYALAKDAINRLDLQNTELIELKGWARNQVPALMSSCDALLMTSLTEGSPQVVKEALACNLPVVSTDVGDVREQLSKVEGSFITTFDPSDIARKLKLAIQSELVTGSREKVAHIYLEEIAEQIKRVYENVIGKNNK